METQHATLLRLHEQELALCEQIDALEEVVASSSTPGIREFRMTRLRQLRQQHTELKDRLRRFSTVPMKSDEAYVLGTAFREACLAAQGAFGR